jgi:hypothetical protein
MWTKFIKEVMMNISCRTSAGTGANLYLTGVMLLLSALALGSLASASNLSISGTLSNFDTYNTTPIDSDGAELELEGIHSIDVNSHYPSHYATIQEVEYNDGVHFGTRVIFDDYNFGGNAVLAPAANPQSTNGHTCVNLPGCEHFGFSVSQQPTAVRFFWHDAGGNRLNVEPLLIPSPSWVYIPPAVPADPPIVRAIVEVPEIEEAALADSIWMKVTVTETEFHTELDDLVSGGPLAGEIEVETEWELLEGGLAAPVEHDFEPDDASRSVIRRYEYYQYLGGYFEPEHEPNSVWNGIGDPPANELGDFIAANMVAVNLVPEPSTLAMLLTAIALVGVRLRR